MYQHAVAEEAGSGQIQPRIFIALHTVNMLQEISLLAGMSRHKDDPGMFGNHVLYLPVLSHSMVADNHAVLLGCVQDFCQPSAGIIVPSMGIGHQFSDQPYAPSVHIFNLITGLLYIIRMHMNSRGIETAVDFLKLQRFPVKLPEILKPPVRRIGAVFNDGAADMHNSRFFQVTARLHRIQIKAFPVHTQAFRL